MLTRNPYFTVEITRFSETTLRVVFSRSDRPAQQMKEHPFAPAETERVAAELAAAVADAAAVEAPGEAAASSSRLAARLVEMILPAGVAAGLASGLPVEFVLDDYCMAFPVEALPGAEGPLGMEVPVVRRWLCDMFPREHRERRGAMEMLIVADPAGSHPAARREGQSVLRFMRSANPDWRIRYLSRKVTGAKLDDELPDTDIFHIAAHMEDAPPGVRMADGLWLPTADSAAPGIVVAACCRAGGLDSAGRDLAGRFLRSGTRQVIAPFAAVSDRLAEFFSCELYREIAAGSNLAHAVFSARKALGTAGLVFVHYGTLPEQVAFQPAQPMVKKRSRDFIIVIALLAAAAALALAFLLGSPRESASGAATTATAVPTAAAASAREVVTVQPQVKKATAATSNVVPQASSKAVVTHAKGDSASASDSEKKTSETDEGVSAQDSGKNGKGGRTRVSEKLLENF